MFNESDIDRLRGAVAYDRNGERIGSIGEVYLDDQTGLPMWVTVNTGFFGLNTSFAPLEGATLEGDDRLVLAHDKGVVKDAPNLAEDGHLDRSQEDELYRYYGVAGGELAGDTLRTRRWGDEGRTEGSGFDRDRDGRVPLGEVQDGPDGSLGDRRGDAGHHVDDQRLGVHGNQGYAGDTGEVSGDRGLTDDAPLLDSDRDGRGPLGEVLDGPDDRRNPRLT